MGEDKYRASDGDDRVKADRVQEAMRQAAICVEIRNDDSLDDDYECPELMDIGFIIEVLLQEANRLRDILDGNEIHKYNNQETDNAD